MRTRKAPGVTLLRVIRLDLLKVLITQKLWGDFASSDTDQKLFIAIIVLTLK